MVTPSPWLTLLILVDLVLLVAVVVFLATRRTRRQRREGLAPVASPLPSVTVRVFFEAERADLARGAVQELQPLADLARAEGRAVTVVGSADATGNAATNRRLTRERAQAVRRFLIGQGVPAASISVDSVEPAWGTTPEDRDKLRCAVVTVR